MNKPKVIKMHGFHFMKRNKKWVILELDLVPPFATLGGAITYVLVPRPI